MSTCWFNEILIDKFGPEAGCAICSMEDCNYTKCDGSCAFGTDCDTCGHPKVEINDCCNGRVLLCLNPECAEDK